jgi:hypothetical protein
MDISDAPSTFHDIRQNPLPHTRRLDRQAWNHFAPGQGIIIAELGVKHQKGQIHVLFRHYEQLADRSTPYHRLIDPWQTSMTSYPE